MRASSFVVSNARLANCLTVTLNNGTVIRVCDATSSIRFPDEALFTRMAGAKLGDLTETNDGNPPTYSFDVSADDGGLFDPYDIDNDLFRDAHVLLEETNANNPVTRDFRFVGRISGDVDYDLAGRVTFQVLSLYATERDVPIRTYQYPCDAIFGDPRRCKIPTFPDLTVGSKDLYDVARLETLAVGDRRRYDYDGSDTPDRYHNVYVEVTAITTGVTAATEPTISDGLSDIIVDGGVTFIVKNAFARSARVGSVYDSRNLILSAYSEPRAATDDWLTPGRLIVRSGYCKNMVADVRAFSAAGSRIEIVQPIANLMNPGDWIEIAPDCTKLPEMCDGKYGNMFNYRDYIHGTGAKLASSTLVDGTTPMPGPTDDPVSEGGGTGGGSGGAGYWVEFAPGSD